MQVNIHEAKTQLSKLLECVESGERVVIARHGTPVAEIIPFRVKGFPFGCAKNDPLVPPGDDWWRPMTDDEADEWTAGR